MCLSAFMKNLNIFEYLDFRAFLKAFYQMRKCENAQFSYTLWGSQAGINNRSYLRLVITGHRNLTDEGIKKILPTLELKKTEQNYFVNLVRFNQAKTIDEKDRQFIALQQLCLKKNRFLQDSYAFLSSHWYPKIQVILGLNDVDRSTGAISKMLSIPLSEVDNYLQALKEQGLTECVGDQWVAKNNYFYVGDDDRCGNFAIQSFHKKSLEIAIEAINQDPQKRYFNSVLVALSEEEYQSLNNELSNFTDQLLVKYTKKSKGKGKKIFQININNIPISSGLIHCHSNASETNERFMGSNSEDDLQGVL